MDKRRRWIAVMIEEALQIGVLDPEDILRHVTPAVLATDLPPELVAEVLQAGLREGGFDSALVVETLGAKRMAQHLPLPLLWSCVAEAAEVITKEHPLDQKRSAEGLPAIDVPAGQMIAEETAEIEVLEE